MFAKAHLCHVLNENLCDTLGTHLASRPQPMMVSWFLVLLTVQAANAGFNIAVLLHAFAERAHLGALA